MLKKWGEESPWTGISNICSQRYMGQSDSCGLNMSHSIFRDLVMREVLACGACHRLWTSPSSWLLICFKTLATNVSHEGKIFLSFEFDLSKLVISVDLVHMNRSHEHGACCNTFPGSRLTKDWKKSSAPLGSVSWACDVRFSKISTTGRQSLHLKPKWQVARVKWMSSASTFLWSLPLSQKSLELQLECAHRCLIQKEWIWILFSSKVKKLIIFPLKMTLEEVSVGIKTYIYYNRVCRRAKRPTCAAETLNMCLRVHRVPFWRLETQLFHSQWQTPPPTNSSGKPSLTPQRRGGNTV